MGYTRKRLSVVLCDALDHTVVDILWQEGRHLLRHASSKDDRTSTQRDDQLAANSTAAHNFIEDLDLLLINQDHRQH